MIPLIIVVLLILFVLGGINVQPAYYPHYWGGGGMGMVFVILLVLWLLGAFNGHPVILVK